MDRKHIFIFSFLLLGLGTHVAADDLKARDEKSEVGLLLPAVQAAREAARSDKPKQNAGLKSDGELVQAKPAPTPLPYPVVKKDDKKPQQYKPDMKGVLVPSFSTGGSANTDAQGPDTGASDCNGVSACNEMIATCIALGGNVTATHYDPDTGAPDGATCYTGN